MNDILTTDELCRRLKVSRTTLWNWRNNGMPVIKKGSLIRYDLQEVLKWLKKNDKN